MIRLGVRAHDFGRHPADDLAARIAAKKLNCVQLALNKAIAGLDLKAGDLNAGLAFEIGQAFLRHKIQIAVLGCYINPLHPDPKTLRGLLDWFKDHLRFARDFGCGLVALETGSLHADYSPHADNHSEEAFQTSLRSIGELVAEAEKFGVVVGIEGVASHAVSTPAKMRRMLDSIGSRNLQVVFDPVNFLSFENHRRQQCVVEESLSLFGDRIVVIHAKDFFVAEDSLRTVPAGQGEFDYFPLLHYLMERKPGINVLLEEVSEEVSDGAIEHLKRMSGIAAGH